MQLRIGLIASTLVSFASLSAIAVSSELPVSHVDRPDLLAFIDLPPTQLTTFAAIDQELPLFQGWCHPVKAKWLYAIVRSLQPKTACEVGVFGGASVYPAALAMLHNGKGSFLAIDPWEAAPCLQGYAAGDPNYEWWAKLDFKAIYDGFILGMARNGLLDIVAPLKMTGEHAIAKVPELDFLHIDGNHSEESALADVRNYLPKCRKGAVIVFDDVNWHSTQRAQAEMLKYADRVFVCEAAPGQQFAVYFRR
jgi:predicted O-methyltransferase YrrM